MTTNPEQMWQRFADEHGLDVNDAGRPFFVDGVMAGRAPADDAGEVALAELIWRTSRDDEGTISATGADHLAQTIIAAGWTMTGADEVERLRDAIKVMEGAWSVCDDERDEARTEVEQLREWERTAATLWNDHTAALAQRDIARGQYAVASNEIKRLKALLKAVSDRG